MFDQLPSPSNPLQQQLIDHFEIQRNICSQYIKMASNQLHMQQAHLISEANDLLQKLTNQHKVKDLSEWDVFTTRDTVIIEDLNLSSINLSGISQQSRGKPIQRRSAMTSRSNKDNQCSLNQCLAELERQCSNKTATTIKGVAEQYKKLKGRVFQLQKREKGTKLKQKIIEQLQQKNVMLSKKFEELERDIVKFKCDLASLKAENNDLTEQIRKKTEEVNSQRKIKIYEEILCHQQASGKKQHKKTQPTNASYAVLNELIEQKEHLIDIRYNQIKNLQQKIEQQLFSEGKRCSRCCQMLKKTKSSIIAYKRYFEKQGANFEQLVEKFKQKLLDQYLVSSWE